MPLRSSFPCFINSLSSFRRPRFAASFIFHDTNRPTQSSALPPGTCSFDVLIYTGHISALTRSILSNCSGLHRLYQCFRGSLVRPSPPYSTVPVMESYTTVICLCPFCRMFHPRRSGKATAPIFKQALVVPHTASPRQWQSSAPLTNETQSRYSPLADCRSPWPRTQRHPSILG